MNKKDIVEKIERVAFENGLFITDFDFSLPTHFENLFQDVNEFLDLFFSYINRAVNKRKIY